MTSKDPTCGKEVDHLRARAVGIFGGATYYFCSPECKAQFQDPRQEERRGSERRHPDAAPDRVPPPAGPVGPAPAALDTEPPSALLPPPAEELRTSSSLRRRPAWPEASLPTGVDAPATVPPAGSQTLRWMVAAGVIALVVAIILFLGLR